MNSNKIICWWSGGVTSAVACNIAIDLYGKENCRVIFIDTKNEDDDTYRFLNDCEKWYGLEIETITSDKYENIQEVWYRYKSLNVAKGAVCSTDLKRLVREKWEKTNTWKHQVFGFDLKESKRAISMTKNHSKTKPIYPLMLYGLEKIDCINIIQDINIEVPRVYKFGYLNNNCFKTGCVQGGIGYWQKIKREYPLKFEAMAKVEHDLTDLKDKPVTMLKDQSKNANEINLVFLKPHKNYPNVKDLSMMKGREPKPLFECNGMCGTNDFEKRSETEKEIHYEQLELF